MFKKPLQNIKNPKHRCAWEIWWKGRRDIESSAETHQSFQHGRKEQINKQEKPHHEWLLQNHTLSPLCIACCVLPVTEPATARGRQHSYIVNHWPPGNLCSLLARSIWFGAPGGTAHWVLDLGASHLSCLYPAIIYILILVCLMTSDSYSRSKLQTFQLERQKQRGSREEISADGGWRMDWRGRQ